MRVSENTGAPSAAARRPSLLGSAGQGDRQVSVLAALGDEAPAGTARPVGFGRRTRWIAGAWLVALVAVGLAWALHEPHAVPARTDEARALASAAPQPAPAPPVQAAASAAALASPASTTLARLEDLPAVATPASAAASAVTSVQAAAERPPAAASAARAARTEPRRTESPRVAAKPAPAGETTRSAKAPAPQKAAAGPAGADADVDLIAALVQHMQRDPRHPNELTIADLVTRCRALPGSEAQRCLQRICENYWGRAEACPRSAAPNDIASRP